MTKQLAPSKNEYQLQIGLNELHKEATEWLSEIEFCRTELSFLNKLLDKYFLRIERITRLTALFDMDKMAKDFKLNELKQLHNVIVSHNDRLATLDENIFFQDEQKVRDEHEHYRVKVQEFISNLRKIKMEIFNFVETEIKNLTKK